MELMSPCTWCAPPVMEGREVHFLAARVRDLCIRFCQRL